MDRPMVSGDNWLWSCLLVIDLPIWLVVDNTRKLNMLSPSLRYLSVISLLLQLSPSPLPHVILTCSMVFQLILSAATSLVPYKSPCWRPASFTPDAMQSEIRSPIALGHRYKRKYLFLTSSLLAYEASVADSIYSAHQQTSTEIKSPFFLIVHHQNHFCFQQHKVICRLSLIIACGRPVLF
jgi:hypothetical protein